MKKWNLEIDSKIVFPNINILKIILDFKNRLKKMWFFFFLNKTLNLSYAVIENASPWYNCIIHISSVPLKHLYFRLNCPFAAFFSFFSSPLSILVLPLSFLFFENRFARRERLLFLSHSLSLSLTGTLKHLRQQIKQPYKYWLYIYINICIHIYISVYVYLSLIGMIYICNKYYLNIVTIVYDFNTTR